MTSWVTFVYKLGILCTKTGEKMYLHRYYSFVYVLEEFELFVRWFQIKTLSKLAHKCIDSKNHSLSHTLIFCLQHNI